MKVCAGIIIGTAPLSACGAPPGNDLAVGLREIDKAIPVVFGTAVGKSH